MRTLRLLVASVRDFGVMATLDQIPLYLVSPLTTWHLRRRKLRELSEDGFDEAHGTDTARILVGRELGPGVNRTGHIVSRYETTSTAAITMPLNSLAIDFSRFVFIDLGCGKGKPLMVAAAYPFRALIGVDISRSCIAVARRNVALYGPDKIDPRRVELLAMDVEDFVFPEAPMVIYMFNPFPAKLLRRVMANLESSLRDKPRPAVIAYVNPSAIEIVSQCELFGRIPTIADRMPALTAGAARHEKAAVFVTRPARAQGRPTGGSPR